MAAAAVISMLSYRRTGVRAFDYRVLSAFLLFFGFGILCISLGHFGWREMKRGAPVDLFHAVLLHRGPWSGHAFLAIGLSITVLTLIGYFFIGGALFLLVAWPSVNGGGLILSGFWMRWGE